MNVAATFGQKVSPVWAYFTNFSPAVPSGLNQGKNVKCFLRRGGGNECRLYTHKGTNVLIGHLDKDHEAEWKMVLAAGSRSAQAKRQRAEALAEAGSTRHLMDRGPGQPVKSCGPPHGQGGAAHIKLTPGPSNFGMMGRGPARPIIFWNDGLRPCPAHQFFR